MRILMIVILILMGNSLFAKTYWVYGKLKNKDSKQPIEFATISVKDSDSDSIVISMITDLKGEFAFEIESGQYKLDISSLGFKPYAKIIKVANKDLYLSPIEIGVEQTKLAQVNVVASSYREEYDRSVQSVTKQFKEGTSNVKDLLEKIRGISVDPLDNSIKVDNGESVLLLVDGIKKEQSYVKNLPPDRVARIEVVRDPTGRYVSQGYSSVINIILKKNYTGYHLLLEEQGFYSLDKSNGDDLLFKNNITASLTYTIKKVNLYGSYSNMKTNTNLFVENSKTLENNKLIKVAPEDVPNLERDGLSHIYLLGGDLFINAKQTLSLETNLIYSPSDENSSTQTYLNQFNDNESFESQLFNEQSGTEQYSLLSYRNEISDKDRLEVDYGYNYAKSETSNTYSENSDELSKQDIGSTRKTSIFDINFNHIFDDTYSIELGYRNTYRIYDYLSLSSDVEQEKDKNLRNLAYAYLSITPKSKIKSKFGVAAEHNKLTVDNRSKNYYSLQPFVNIFYNHSKNLNLTLKFNSDSDYPYTSQVNPLETTTDRLTSNIGNPNLSFATKYTSSLAMKLFKNKISIEPYYSVTKNHISQIGNIVDEYFQYTYSNLDRYESIGLNLSTRFAIIPRYMSFALSGSLFHDKTELNGYSNNVSDFSISSNLIYMEKKYKTLYALMLKKMNVKQINAYGYSSNNNDYINIFIKQSLFRRKLTLSALYILPVDFGLNYVMEDHFKDGDFQEDNKTNVDILTNLFMLKLTFNLNKGNKIESIDKNNYKERKQSKGFF